MPLTDFLKHFLQKLPENIQYLGTDVAPMLGPNWQQAIQQEQQRQLQMGLSQQQQENWEKQFGAQQAQQGQENQFRQGQLQLGALEHNIIPYQPSQAQGGPGLTQNSPASPSLAGAKGGGSNQPTSQPGPSADPNAMLGNWGAFMNGMQQAPSQGVNQPNQVPGGMAMSPSNRMPSMGGDSGAGGAIAAAAPRPLVPTPFNISGLPGQYQQRPEAQIPVPPELQKEGFPATMPESQFKGIQQYIDTRERLAALAAKPGKEEKEPEAIQQTAAQLTAKAQGLQGTFKRINDLPLEHQAAAWEKDRELRSSEADKINKQLAIQGQKDREEKYANQKASDTEVLGDIQRDPQGWFSIKDKDQQARVRTLAQQQGIRLPTREIKPNGQMADSLVAADTVQQQVDRMKQIATALGPASFGAMMGRLKNAEGDWGDPVFTDPTRAGLEEEFRGYSRNLSAQEAKLVGGGRTSVVIYNAIKGVTPGQWMDPAILEGAFRQAVNRAQITKNAINRWQYGDISDPYKNFNDATGKFGTIGGKRVRVTGHDDKTGKITYVEAPAQ